MTDVRWQGQSHETLYNWINSGPGAKASNPQIEFWDNLKSSLSDISTRLGDSLGSIDASWQGIAAESARSGLTPLQQWADEALASADVMRQSSQIQAEHVSSARAAMPEPVPQTTPQPSSWATQQAATAKAAGNPNPAQALAKQAGDAEAQETAASNAAEKANQVLAAYATASNAPAGTLARVVSPPNVVVDVPLPAGSRDSVAYLANGGPQTNFASQSTSAAGFIAPGTSATPSFGGAAGAPAAAGGGAGMPGGFSGSGTSSAAAFTTGTPTAGSTPRHLAVSPGGEVGAGGGFVG
ncbi:MAG: PPE domain-containing protein, partial [Sciscionella sp.]